MLAALPTSASQETAIDLVCRAIADGSRRRILDLLATGPLTTGRISDEFETSRFAVMKHLRILEEAGLVVVTRRGRERWNHLNAVPLQRLHDRWVSPLAEEGAKALLNLQRLLEKD